MVNAYFFYLISHRLYKAKIPFLPSLVKLFIFMLYNSSIPFQAKIGKGTKFAYGGIGVILHKKTIIGKNCMIGSNVTIGGKTGSNGLPVIMDNVNISTGAKIIGNVRIGYNSIIGANAVVLKDVPDNTVVAGVPAKIIKTV